MVIGFGALEIPLMSDFWRGKRVFLTGHTGFKGGWAAIWLKMWGAEVCGYALPPSTDPSLYEIANVGKGIQSVLADIRDFDRLKVEVSRFKPDIAIHMAAQPLVRYSYEAPVETYATNVMGTVHVLEALRAAGTARVIVNVTSDKCYENREWIWGYRENEPMGGHDPYSSSKGCSELITSSYQKSFFNDPSGAVLASGRAGNVVGGGDWSADRLIPDVIRAFLKDEPVAIRNPNSIRPWQHVLEPVGGYLLLAEKLWHERQTLAGGWNFGPDQDAARPVREVVEMIKQCWDAPRVWEDCSDPHAPHEAKFLFLDVAKARMRLGWRPRWTLRQTLDATVTWYRSVDRGEDARQLCEMQIRDYIAGSHGLSLGHAV
ncbi:CDP-glucose 4,6-dehydratase [Rhodopseudomonas palustris]